MRNPSESGALAKHKKPTTTTLVLNIITQKNWKLCMREWPSILTGWSHLIQPLQLPPRFLQIFSWVPSLYFQWQAAYCPLGHFASFSDLLFTFINTLRCECAQAQWMVLPFIHLVAQDRLQGSPATPFSSVLISSWPLSTPCLSISTGNPSIQAFMVLHLDSWNIVLIQWFLDLNFTPGHF